MNEIEERIELAMLFDFYGGLLKEHTKEIFEDYILNDLSLSEIAVSQGITRQGVHDVVKRCSKQLREYESELLLVRKFRQTKERLQIVKELLSQSVNKSLSAEAGQALALTEEILKDL